MSFTVAKRTQELGIRIAVGQHLERAPPGIFGGHEARACWCRARTLRSSGSYTLHSAIIIRPHRVRSDDFYRDRSVAVIRDRSSLLLFQAARQRA